MQAHDAPTSIPQILPNSFMVSTYIMLQPELSAAVLSLSFMEEETSSAIKSLSARFFSILFETSLNPVFKNTFIYFF